MCKLTPTFSTVWWLLPDISDLWHTSQEGYDSEKWQSVSGCNNLCTMLCSDTSACTCGSSGPHHNLWDRLCCHPYFTEEDQLKWRAQVKLEVLKRKQAGRLLSVYDKALWWFWNTRVWADCSFLTWNHTRTRKQTHSVRRPFGARHCARSHSEPRREMVWPHFTPTFFKDRVIDWLQVSWQLFIEHVVSPG